MNCTNCGASVIQGPNGGWSCGNCGASGGIAPGPRPLLPVAAH